MYLHLFFSKIIVKDAKHFDDNASDQCQNSFFKKREIVTNNLSDAVKIKEILRTYHLECVNFSDIKLFDNSTQSITYGAANNSSSDHSEKEEVNRKKCMLMPTK